MGWVKSILQKYSCPTSIRQAGNFLGICKKDISTRKKLKSSLFKVISTLDNYLGTIIYSL